MKLRRRHKNHTAVEASSLSDILFFLMLFFLMISTMASPSAIKMLLPASKSQTNIPKQLINLYIDKNFSYQVESETVTFETLQAKIETLSKTMKDPTVVIRADKSTPIEELIKVIDLVNDLKLQSVIATSKKQ